MNIGRLAGEHILNRSEDRWAAMGRFLVPVLQFVNIVQMIVNNVRASSGARRYTLVTYQTPCLRRAQPHMKSDGRQFSVLYSNRVCAKVSDFRRRFLRVSSTTERRCSPAARTN